MTREKELRDSDGAAGSFVHPGEGIDEADSIESHLKLLGVKEDVADIFRRLFVMCMFGRSPYRGGRGWKASYNRMVAICYVLSPEMLDGMRQKDVAKTLGISERMFRSLISDVTAMLAARPLANRKPRSKLPR